MRKENYNDITVVMDVIGEKRQSGFDPGTESGQ